MSDTNLNVPLTIQEHSNWCWAASNCAVLRYFGKSVTQCDIVSFKLNDSCCGSYPFDSSNSCNSPGSLGWVSSILRNWDIYSRRTYSLLSQPEVVAEINNNQPFIMTWQWTGGGGHELVGYGYDQNGLYLNYMDPWPGHGFTKSSISWVQNSSGHNWVDTAKTVINYIGQPKDVWPELTPLQSGGPHSNVSVSFSAPESNVPITSYTVISDPDNITVTGARSPIIIENLSYGTRYTFAVYAISGSLSGPGSISYNSIIPYTYPGVPTNVTATAGAGEATVFFTPPNDNGRPISLYEVTASPCGRFAEGIVSPITVSGLTSGTTYTFTVRARNIAGSGQSSQSNSVTPSYSIPDAPTNVTATFNNNSGYTLINFTPPNNNGSVIDYYKVIANPGNIAFNSSTSGSSISIGGLQGVYSFTLMAHNIVGFGPASSPSNNVTTFTKPGAPTNVLATAGFGRAIVSFKAPINNGGNSITSYTVYSNPGSFSATGTISPITVTSLNGGTSYAFTVSASNNAGSGPHSSQSNIITPTYSVPNVPTNVTAIAGIAQGIVSFTIPESNGRPITSYTVTSNPGNIMATGTTSPITVTGLTNGGTYNFTVKATNIAGNSSPSSPSNNIYLVNVPNEPTGVIATAQNAGAYVSFIAPSINGGLPITSYRVTSNPGNRVATGTLSPIRITGLTNGTAYNFTVNAANSVGFGPSSIPSNSVTPLLGIPQVPALGILSFLAVVGMLVMLTIIRHKPKNT